MKFQLCILLGAIPLSLGLTLPVESQIVLEEGQDAWKRETMEEAAVRARDLIENRSDGLGTLISVWPSDYQDESLALSPIGLQEYFAPLPNGDLVLLAMNIAPIYRNAFATPGKNITISIKDELSERENGNMWAAARARLILYGSLHNLNYDTTPSNTTAEAYYVATHPDSKMWVPPDGPHRAFWTLFKVEKIYFFGGFGDRAWIGWMPVDLYRESSAK